MTRHPVAETLEREPYLFEFFQAVRLLERLRPDREPVGRFVNPANEVARFGAHASTAFPASQIQSYHAREGAQPLLRVNFMGLTGPLGVLPLYYTELVVDRLRSRDTTLRDFLDIFNHRMISLFYQAWEKYRFAIAYERDRRDRVSQRLLDLIGLGSPGLEDRQRVSDRALMFYGGLLSLTPRSTTALEQILEDYFGAPAEIEQFVGAWYPIEADSQCSLGAGAGYSEQLGVGVVVGNEIWDQQSRVRIRLGPLTLVQYRSFLPGGDAHEQLRALARFFAGGEYDIEAQLILRREDVPACELAAREEEGLQLGWTTWMKSGPFERDPGETVFSC